MASGLTGGLENILGVDANAGSSQLQQALAAIQAIQGPSAAQLTLPQLQQYVQEGLLTPEQYQAVSANPEAYAQSVAQTQDNSGQNAQKAALQQLGQVVQNGGSTPINQANLTNNINQTNQAMQAARQGIQENAEERGVAGGGQEFLNELLNEQGNAQTANLGAVNAGANNAQLALNALSQEGTLGGNVQSQSNAMTQAQAQAAQQIAEYNSQLQSSANQYNTQNANAAQAANLTEAQNLANANVGNANAVTQYNAQVPETVYNNNLGKAQSEAGIYSQQGQLAQQQAQQGASLTGGILGAGAQLGAGYLAGQNNKVSGTPATPSTPAGMDVTSQDYTANAAANNPNPGYAMGGMVHHETGERCYAEGGEVHDHSICMKVGGKVPGQAMTPGNSSRNDTVPAKLSPGEIVLPRSVTQSSNPAANASKFVQKTKGGENPGEADSGVKVNSFKEALDKLEENGLELRLHAKGS